MNRRGLLLCAGALALAGCATSPPPKPGAEPAQLEAVYGLSAARDGVTVRVASNGCTKKEDFAFYVDRTSAVPTLMFGRKRLDTCKSFAAGQAPLTFPWAELGLAPGVQFALLNPLIEFPGP